MRVILCCFMLMIAMAADASTIIDVTAYGAKPNSFEDATTFLQKAIAACDGSGETILSFPKGRYDFWPAGAAERTYFISNTSSEEECPSKLKRIGLLFENKKNIIVEGNGSLFVFHGKMITFTFDHCTNITLQNIEEDFERPTMSEMTFEEVSDSSITASVHPDSKFAILNDTLRWYGEGWGMHQYFAILVHPSDSTFTYSSWQPFSQAKATLIGTNKVQFSGSFNSRLYAKGSVLTIRDPVRDQVGMFIHLSKGITLVNVQMHYMHGLGIISQFSENLLFDSVQIIPSHNRMIAAFADGMHFSGCRGTVTIQYCRFKGLHDDAINVHGTQLRIVETLSPNTVKLRFMHAQTYGFPAYYAGDTVHFVHSASLQRYASAIVSNARLVADKEMIVSFSSPLPADMQKEDCIENITWTPSLTVSHCLLEATNTRGLLVTSPRKVTIDNNTFSKTGMQAILIADDASSWYESGAVKDVTITNNHFINCGYNLNRENYTIAIAPENHILQKNYYVHSNIRVAHNTFVIAGGPLLTARSTCNLIFENNTVLQPGSRKQPLINLTACDKVEINNNEFVDEKPVVAITSMSLKSVTGDVKEITEHKQ